MRTWPVWVARSWSADQRAKRPLPFVVVLNNIRSLYNVGSVFRTSDGAGVSKIYCCGITGYPPNAMISKTALGAEAQVPFEYRQDVAGALKELKQEGYEIVFLEQTDQSVPFEEYVPKGPVCLVIGNEIEGISQAAVAFCDRAVEIEMEGVKNSLNVSVAFGILAFHIKAHLKQECLL